MREAPELGLVDLQEKQRLQDVADKKARGKGPPKKITKKKDKGEGRRSIRKR